MFSRHRSEERWATNAFLHLLTNGGPCPERISLVLVFRQRSRATESRYGQDRFWDIPSLLSNGYRG
jgi:hypothetical protein